MTNGSTVIEDEQEAEAVGHRLDRSVMRQVACRWCAHSDSDHDRQYGCGVDGCDCERFGGLRTVAALYVEPKGCYVGVHGVDPWDESRDARKYAGPHPVVAHPPCQRWGRFWHGSTRKPHQYKLGADGGCFRAALAAIRRYGGVLEHPADSRAWEVHGMTKPPRSGGWVKVDSLADRDDVPQAWKDDSDMWTCCVYQGHYGHPSGKATWLVTAGIAREDLPELKWGKTEQRLPEWMIERYGYEKARRIGVVAMVGGKNKTAIRNATPIPFRDLLLSIARKAHNDEFSGRR